MANGVELRACTWVTAFTPKLSRGRFVREDEWAQP